MKLVCGQGLAMMPSKRENSALPDQVTSLVPVRMNSYQSVSRLEPLK